MLKVKDGTGCGIAYCILLLLMLIMAFFVNDMTRILIYFVEILMLPLVPSFFKEVQMFKDGCLIKVFFW